MSNHVAQPVERQTERTESIRNVYSGMLMPDLQAEAFRHSELMFPTRTIKCGAETSTLDVSNKVLPKLHIVSGQKSYDLCDYVSQNRVAGLLILKDGKIIHEQYELGNDVNSHWISMSMAKSVATTLVGAAIQDGFIGSVHDDVVKYLPELSGSSFEGVSVENIMHMSSGVRWNDTHTDPDSDRTHMLDLQVRQEAGSILQYMATLPRVANPGEIWNYSTGETHLIGALLRAATGKWLSDYLSEKIWSKIGMQADAFWWLESEKGLEVAGSGMSATLRDYARFGVFAMNEGKIRGVPVLPQGFMKTAGTPKNMKGTDAGYGYMWWPVSAQGGTVGAHNGAFSARGIFGQYIYINPSTRTLIAVNSSRSKPRFAESILDNDFFNAVNQALLTA